MGALNRVVGLLIGVLVVAAGGTAWADSGPSDKQPEVSGTAVSDITSSGALLKATVHPQGRDTTYVFEYGRTTAYGSQTVQASAGDSDSAQPVSAGLTGLLSATTYHFRVVATNDKGTTWGVDRSFTTLASPATDPPSDSDPGATAPAAVEPELGSSVLVAPAGGTLLVRRPGASSFEPLELGSALPMGTEVDATAGALVLTSALPSGATQTGRFGGGRFVIRQGRRGYVDLYLRGPYCSASRTAGTAATAARTVKRRLWGRDHGGRFRTHGRNSHATVRGTKWSVADGCKGTLTRVTSGSVIVRDTVRRKRVVLKAGERYLARPRG